MQGEIVGVLDLSGDWDEYWIDGKRASVCGFLRKTPDYLH